MARFRGEKSPIRQANRRERAVSLFDHFSPRYQDVDETKDSKDGLTMRDVEAEARAVYDGRLFLARDFDRYLLDRQGVLSRAE